MEGKDLAYWLADKIPACGDYAKQAAQVLRKQADEIERLREAIAPLAECHLPPAGYEHLGVTAHFKTEQIIAAKDVVPNERNSGAAEGDPAGMEG